MYYIRQLYGKKHVVTGSMLTFRRILIKMSENHREKGFLIKLGLLCLLAVIGFDLFLHAGILSPLYKDPGTFLLSPETAFKLIPVGYLSFAILILLLAWLMIRSEVSGLSSGFVFGLKVGLLIWLSLGLGLVSITSAPYKLIIGWVIGQSLELGLAGAVIGHGLERASLKKTGLYVLVFFILCVILAIVLQNVLNSVAG